MSYQSASPVDDISQIHSQSMYFPPPLQPLWSKPELQSYMIKTFQMMEMCYMCAVKYGGQHIGQPHVSTEHLKCG